MKLCVECGKPLGPIYYGAIDKPGVEYRCVACHKGWLVPAEPQVAELRDQLLAVRADLDVAMRALEEVEQLVAALRGVIGEVKQ